MWRISRRLVERTCWFKYEAWLNRCAGFIERDGMRIVVQTLTAKRIWSCRNVQKCTWITYCSWEEADRSKSQESARVSNAVTNANANSVKEMLRRNKVKTGIFQIKNFKVEKTQKWDFQASWAINVVTISVLKQARFRWGRWWAW